MTHPSAPQDAPAEQDIKDRLREQDSSRATCFDVDMLCNEAASVIEQLERQLAEAKQDAGRYRHMRNLTGAQTSMPGQPSIAVPSGLIITGKDADFAIDTAMQAKGPK